LNHGFSGINGFHGVFFYGLFICALLYAYFFFDAIILAFSEEERGIEVT